MRKLSIVVLLASALFVTASIFAEENSSRNITIKVKVTNATTDGKTVLGDTAFITLFDNNKEVETIEALVDESAMAVFEYALGDQHLLAWPRVRHQDMMYSAPKLHIHYSPDPIEVEAEVYDVSENNSVITIGSHHMMIKTIGNSVHITEFLQIKNSTNMAITSAKKDALDRPQVITFFLPAGFQEFDSTRYFAKTALVMTADSFYDTMAIPPGDYNAMFSYTLPITSEEMQITKKISMPTEGFMVFSQLESGQLTGLGASVGKLTLEDGSPSEYFASTKKTSGDQIVMTITGLKTASSKLPIIITVVIFFLIVPLLILKLKSSMRKKKSAEPLLSLILSRFGL